MQTILHSSYVFRQEHFLFLNGSTLWICVTDSYENTISAQKLMVKVCSTLQGHRNVFEHDEDRLFEIHPLDPLRPPSSLIYK